MSPLTLLEKYEDLVRGANQPASSYQRLTSDDLEAVLSKRWPFIVESVSFTPPADPLLSDGECRTRLERRLKIHFSLYADVAKKYQLKFPHRMSSVEKKRSDRSFSSSFLTAVDLPDFYVLCPPGQVSAKIKDLSRDHDRLRKYLSNTSEDPPVKMRVLQQTIQVIWKVLLDPSISFLS